MVPAWIKKKCPDCHGEKVIYCGGVPYDCPHCHGKGFIWKNTLEDFPPDKTFLQCSPDLHSLMAKPG
jgi:hypothetical protein